ncbi:DUF2283 domain-containing protein [Candidatus Woesearchaeota archaeon]|nr:DUF2283 domain-containing protein [Candidatus Woesearchaeota archaeon]
MCLYRLLCEKNPMKQKMRIHYDKEADFLEVMFGEPSESYYEDLGNDIFERRDEKTGLVKGYAIFNVQKCTANKDIGVEIPVG